MAASVVLRARFLAMGADKVPIEESPVPRQRDESRDQHVALAVPKSRLLGQVSRRVHRARDVLGNRAAIRGDPIMPGSRGAVMVLVSRSCAGVRMVPCRELASHGTMRQHLPVRGGGKREQPSQPVIEWSC